MAVPSLLLQAQGRTKPSSEARSQLPLDRHFARGPPTQDLGLGVKELESSLPTDREEVIRPDLQLTPEGGRMVRGVDLSQSPSGCSTYAVRKHGQVKQSWETGFLGNGRSSRSVEGKDRAGRRLSPSLPTHSTSNSQGNRVLTY